MADIQSEITSFKSAVYGEDVRDAMVSLANKLNDEGTTSLLKVITQFKDDWYLDSNRARFKTTGTFTRGGTIFSDLNFIKNKTYVFEVVTDSIQDNNGYFYMIRSDGSTLNTFRITPDNNPFYMEYTPTNDYSDIDIVLGWGTINVLGIVRIYEKRFSVEELADLLIEEGEEWI